MNREPLSLNNPSAGAARERYASNASSIDTKLVIFAIICNGTGKKPYICVTEKRSVNSMVFKLRVTLSGIKGFFRVYNVHGATTLYTLHKQLRADLEFPQDAIIMFKALDVTGSVVGRYGLFDLGWGTVDETSLEKAVKAGATDFVYFYDVTNRKSVNITVEYYHRGRSGGRGRAAGLPAAGGKQRPQPHRV